MSLRSDMQQNIQGELNFSATPAGETRETGRDTEARRRGAKAWHPDRAGPLHSAGGDAGSATAVGPNIFRSQLRFSTGTIGASGCSAGTAVHCRRLQLGG